MYMNVYREISVIFFGGVYCWALFAFRTGHVTMKISMVSGPHQEILLWFNDAYIVACSQYERTTCIYRVLIVLWWLGNIKCVVFFYYAVFFFFSRLQRMFIFLLGFWQFLCKLLKKICAFVVLSDNKNSWNCRCSVQTSYLHNNSLWY